MKQPQMRENEAYVAVMTGELEVDIEGRVWRTARRRWNRWMNASESLPVTRRRAENQTTRGYLQVRVMLDGKRVHALAHRLVYRHFFGPIPPGMTINHKSGIKSDNRPENLELATPSENTLHSLRVLKHGRIDQRGTANAMVKLTAAQVAEIRTRRTAGEKLASIAADFGVTYQTVSKIARGDRWA